MFISVLGVSARAVSAEILTSVTPEQWTVDMEQHLCTDVELASETPTVDPNLEFSVVIYFEMFKDISSSDKLPRPSMSRHTEVGIWRTQIKVKYMYTITNIKLYPGWSSWK